MLVPRQHLSMMHPVMEQVLSKIKIMTVFSLIRKCCTKEEWKGETPECDEYDEYCNDSDAEAGM